MNLYYFNKVVEIIKKNNFINTEEMYLIIECNGFGLHCNGSNLFISKICSTI